MFLTGHGRAEVVMWLRLITTGPRFSLFVESGRRVGQQEIRVLATSLKEWVQRMVFHTLFLIF